ncbi:glycosyltransferase [Roseiconus lacunae]|uniref:Glycosyltransferase n=1 Tax=Roseiconus lacunae TaxID=2605694 RepID=A0ABT7PQQ7_9BACT|nr:glycosyltransferase [Roseiconus lacunae]MDM4018847.1 glycosyltransferase [Roseiconus lacunae]
MIRVAYVVHSFDVGGLERCVAHLANRLDRDSFVPLIVSLTELGDARDWVSRDDVKLFELHKPPGNDLSFPARLANLFAEQEVDLVHSHNWGTLLESVLAVRKLRKISPRVVQLVHAEHGLELDRYRTSGGRRFLRQGLMAWGFRQCDATIAIAHCVSHWMKNSCRTPAARHHLIPNGVECPITDAADSKRFREELGIPGNAFLLGSVGRAVSLKGFPIALNALHHVGPSDRQPHWLLAGDGPELVELREQTQRLNLSDRVHLLGTRNDLGKIFGAIDAILNTSHTEAMNLAILEAMACGKAVIASDVGDNAVLIGRSCAYNQGDEAFAGEVFPDGDVQRLASIVNRWAQNDGIVQAYGSVAASRYNQLYTLDQMVKKYQSLYRQVYEQNSAPCVL